MEEYQLRRMVERRGYTLEPPIMAHLMTWDVVRGEERVLQISVFELENLTAKALLPALDHAVGMRHTIMFHMCCLNCHAPLLQCKNHDRAIELYKSLTLPMTAIRLVQAQQEIKEAIVTEYRDAKQGPASEPIKSCPVCLLPIDEKNVVEITDPEMPTVKFDFGHAMHQIQQMSAPSAAEAEEIQRKLLEWARQEGS